jgi:hypothetical protein
MKRVIIPMMMLISCNKSEYVPPTKQAVIEFKMGNAYYKFTQDELRTNEAFPNCGLRLYEIEIYTSYQHFFKIDVASRDTLEPGQYFMGETPTNSVVNTSTFWFQGDGISYTARKPFTVTVTKYENHEISGYFSGDSISNGIINHLKINEK